MNPQANQPLLPWQKARLMMIAKEAFAASLARFAVDDTTDFNEWRAIEQGRACDLPTLGLREATQAQYRLIRGHWHVILGNAEAAFADFMAGGQENEARRQTTWHLAAAVSTLAEFWKKEKGIDDAEAARQAWAYALAIGRDKAKGRPLGDMSPKELRQLAFTVINRTSAFRGVGNPNNRNKSQRARRRKPSAPSNPDRAAPPTICQTDVLTRF